LYKSLKSIIDFLVSLIATLILSPLLLVIAILCKLTGEGEVFYRQERMGYRNVPFGILKFATMLKNSPNIGSKTITVRNDPRVTPIGKWLRITKLNELPQIINVLKGDMSFVGPRPLLVASVAKYAEEVQKCIYQNKPGITGMGSLVFRDEEKLVTDVRNLGGEPMAYYKEHIYPYKGALELWYYHHQSFPVDLKILILTAWSILFKNTDMVYKSFPDLPIKPDTLTVEGIKKLHL